MYKHLTREQRCEIFALLQHKATKKEIAAVLKVSPSTISREIKRNSTKNGNYIWNRAQSMAQERIHRLPGNRSIDDIVKWRIVQLILDEQWSPKQISGYLAKYKEIHVSHETIYKIIRADESGRLAQNCRHKMKYKRSRTRRHETKPVSIKNRVSIHDRPKEADGTRFGDWEMDLIVDKHSNAILTLVERSANYLLAVRSTCIVSPVVCAETVAMNKVANIAVLAAFVLNLFMLNIRCLRLSLLPTGFAKAEQACVMPFYLHDKRFLASA